MSNYQNTTIYTGVTGDLLGRVLRHKTKINKKSFTVKYKINKLVYYEEHSYIDNAIAREKQIKAGPRKKKIELIESSNPNWKDLSPEWY